MTTRFLPVLVAFAAILISHPAAAAKAKKDFSGFKGTYTGAATLTGTGFSNVGTVTANIVVPKNGKSANITISGAVDFGGIPAPISSTVTLTGGTISISNLSFIAMDSIAGSGAYTLASPKAFTFSASGADGMATASASGSVTITPQGKKKQTITFAISLVAPGGTENLTLVLTGKTPIIKK